MRKPVASEAGTAEQKRTQERKRNIIVLIMHHLFENGELVNTQC